MNKSEVLQYIKKARKPLSDKDIIKISSKHTLRKLISDKYIKHDAIKRIEITKKGEVYQKKQQQKEIIGIFRLTSQTKKRLIYCLKTAQFTKKDMAQQLNTSISQISDFIRITKHLFLIQTKGTQNVYTLKESYRIPLKTFVEAYSFPQSEMQEGTKKW